MDFEVTTGLGKIYICDFEDSAYLCCKTPVCMNWIDSNESRYLAVLPYDEKYRESVFEPIREGLYEDFSENEQGLYNLLQPLLAQFANGEYYLGFYNENDDEHPIYLSGVETPWFYSVDGIEQFTEKPYTDPTGRCTIFYLDSIQEPHWYIGGNEDVVASKPTQDFDSERVLFFENEIKNGKRPFAILFHGERTFFVLDGHHKLRAYYNLGIIPPVTVIRTTYEPHLKEIKDESTIRDVEYLSKNMYSPHLEYFIAQFFEFSSNSFLEIIKEKDVILYIRLIKIYKKYIEKKEKSRVIWELEFKKENIVNKQQIYWENSKEDNYSSNLTGKEILLVIVIIILALLLILSLT